MYLQYKALNLCYLDKVCRHGITPKYTEGGSLCVSFFAISNFVLFRVLLWLCFWFDCGSGPAVQFCAICGQKLYR